MALTVTINGVDRSSYVKLQSVRIDMGYRSAWTARFLTVDRDGSASAYRPALDQTVVIADGATTVFRGWVFGMRDDPVAPPGEGTAVEVACKAYDALLDAITVDKVYGGDPIEIANSSVANPTSITTVQPHGYTTGDLVTIENHVGSTATVNGTHTVTVTSHSTFTVPINNTSSGGGGTARKVTRANTIVADLHATYLNSRGVSLDTLSAAAVLSKQVFDGATLRSVLDHIAQITGWAVRITPAPQLQFFAAGTKTAGYSLTTTNNVGAVSWEQQRQRYINTVILDYGRESVVRQTDILTGDGATNIFSLRYTARLDANEWPLSAGYVLENNNHYPLAPLTDIVSSSVANPTTIRTRTRHGLENGTVAIQGHTGSTPAISGNYTATVTDDYSFTIPVNVTVAGTGGTCYDASRTWLFYAANNQLHRAGGNLASEVTATFAYDVQYPQTLTVDDSGEVAARGVWEGRFDWPDGYDVNAATEVANGILRRELAKPQQVTTAARQSFVMPGDSQTWTFTNRTIASASYLIQEVHITSDTDGVLRYAITANSGTEFRDTPVDIMRDVAKGSNPMRASSGTVTGSLVAVPSGASSGNVLANQGTDYEEVEIGAVSAGTLNSNVVGVRFGRTTKWVMGVRPKQSPGTGSGYEMVLFDANLSNANPLLRLIDDSVNVIIALNSTFTSTRGVAIGEDASGKRFVEGNFLTLRAQTAYYERGRSDALGEWTTIAYADANFTGDAAGNADWVVDSADQRVLRYMRVGKSCVLQFSIQNSDVANGPTQLRITLPAAIAISNTAGQDRWTALFRWAEGATNGVGRAVIDASTSTTTLLLLKLSPSGAWANTSSDDTTIDGQIVFETAS